MNIIFTSIQNVQGIKLTIIILNLIIFIYFIYILIYIIYTSHIYNYTPLSQDNNVRTYVYL